MCDISIREYIRWLPNASEEPTSTIVLTTPERRYVDIRVLKPTSLEEDAGGEGVACLRLLQHAHQLMTRLLQAPLSRYPA